MSAFPKQFLLVNSTQNLNPKPLTPEPVRLNRFIEYDLSMNYLKEAFYFALKGLQTRPEFNEKRQRDINDSLESSVYKPLLRDGKKEPSNSDVATLIHTQNI